MRVEVAVLRVVIVDKKPYRALSWVHASEFQQRLCRLTMVGIEDFPDKQEKPLLSQSTSIDTLLSEKLNAKAFLDLFLSGPDHLTHATQAVLDETVSPHFQNKVLADGAVIEDAVEKCLTCLHFHLTTRIVFQNMNLCPYAKEERVDRKSVV